MSGPCPSLSQPNTKQNGSSTVHRMIDGMQSRFKFEHMQFRHLKTCTNRCFAVPPDVGLWGMNGVSQTRELVMQSCPSSVVVNTQGREFGGSWFETCSGVWYPRRRPCGVAINTFADLINWLGKPKDLVFIGDPLTTSRTKSSDRRTSASRCCGQYSLAIMPKPSALTPCNGFTVKYGDPDSSESLGTSFRRILRRSMRTSRKPWQPADQ